MIGGAAFTVQYVAELREFLGGSGEGGLHRAHELGRRALEHGLGILEMAAMHHEALDQLQISRDVEVTADVRSFFLESLSPFEMTHRGFRDGLAAFHRVNELMEVEAKRIAHALHDEASQSLAAACIALESMDRDLPESVRPRMESVLGTVRETADRIRRISHELRPTVLDDLGLVPALEFLAEGIATRTGLRVSIKGAIAGRLPLPIETTLYRVAQEAVANAIRHAHARRMTIRLGMEKGMIRCSIRDDGDGFDVESVLARKGDRGLGLMGIRERLNALGGTLSILSTARQGTELRIDLPTEATHVTPYLAG